MITLMDRLNNGETAQSVISAAQDEINKLSAEINALKNKYKPMSDARIEELGTETNLFSEHYSTIIKAITSELLFDEQYN